MNKARSKEKLKYVEKLDIEPREQYFSKLCHVNGFDPYNQFSFHFGDTEKSLLSIFHSISIISLIVAAHNTTKLPPGILEVQPASDK